MVRSVGKLKAEGSKLKDEGSKRLDGYDGLDRCVVSCLWYVVCCRAFGRRPMEDGRPLR
jgi:hypothetical protein